jgi:hypothetical protein
MMKACLIFPVAMMVLSVCAGIVYAAHGDVRQAIYWFAGAVLNAAVTF